MAMMHCQKCRTPLKLDSSLSELNPAAFKLLVGTGSALPPQPQSKTSLPSRSTYPPERKALFDQVSKDAASQSFKRGASVVGNGPPSPETNRPGGKDNQAMSFYMLSESEMVPPPVAKLPESNGVKKIKSDAAHHDGAADEEGAMSYEMARVAKLFEILSSRSDIDHPICVECTDLLIDGLQRRLEEAIRERDAYAGFIKQVTEDIPTEKEAKDSDMRLAKAKAEEEAALQELVQLEKEKDSVDDEIIRLEEEARILDVKEEEFWRSRNAFAMTLAEFQNTRDSINQKYDHDSQQLEKLQRTNVYNDTFCISHDGSFGTINGLRLGRLSSIPVDWPEINAAWGHTLLLLATVAERLSFDFENFELQPMGSTSRIIKIENQSPASSRTNPQRRSLAPKKTVLELYSSGDMPLGLTFMHRKFDLAMVAFLECMRQLGAYVESETSRTGRPIKLPYKIEGEKIGDVSIKLGIAQDDDWSKACKFALTCCKFLLAHASNVNMAGRRN